VEGPTGPTGPGVTGPTGPSGPVGDSFSGILSTTSITIAEGTITFAVNDVGAYSVGNRVRLSSNDTPADFIEGIVVDIFGTDFAVLVDKTNGLGNTYNDWNLGIGAGEVGPTGPTGAQGTAIQLVGSVATFGDLPASAGQNDAYTTFRQNDKSSPWIAPLAVMTCEKLSFIKSRSILTGKIDRTISYPDYDNIVATGWTTA
jgi:hypothetical protein